MQIEVMHAKDIDSVLTLYIDYYNNQEDGCWTGATAKNGKAGYHDACNFVMKVKWFE